MKNQEQLKAALEKSHEQLKAELTKSQELSEKWSEKSHEQFKTELKKSHEQFKAELTKSQELSEKRSEKSNEQFTAEFMKSQENFTVSLEKLEVRILAAQSSAIAANNFYMSIQLFSTFIFSLSAVITGFYWFGFTIEHPMRAFK